MGPQTLVQREAFLQATGQSAGESWQAHDKPLVGRESERGSANSPTWRSARNGTTPARWGSQEDEIYPGPGLRVSPPGPVLRVSPRG